MKKFLIYSLCYLLIACNVKGPQFVEDHTEKYRLFETAGKKYDLNVFSMRNGIKKYSIRINGVAYGPVIEKDSTGHVKEVKIFWNDTLSISKTYHWNEDHLDSIQLYTYKKLQPNKYEGIKRMTSSKVNDKFIQLRFPLFSCNKQRTTLCQRNFDNSFIFPNLSKEADEASYKQDKYYSIDRLNNEVNIVSENITNDKNTFAVDFTNRTSNSEMIDIWSILFVHPTIVINCDSLPEYIKKEVLNREFVF